MQVVLERGSGEKQLALGVKLPHDLRQLAVLVLDLVGLVDHDVVPFDLLQTVEADPHSLETSHQDVEFALIDHLRQNLLSLILGGNQFHDFGAR